MAEDFEILEEIKDEWEEDDAEERLTAEDIRQSTRRLAIWKRSGIWRYP